MQKQCRTQAHALSELKTSVETKCQHATPPQIINPEASWLLGIWVGRDAAAVHKQVGAEYEASARMSLAAAIALRRCLDVCRGNGWAAPPRRCTRRCAHWHVQLAVATIVSLLLLQTVCQLCAGGLMILQSEGAQ